MVPQKCPKPHAIMVALPFQGHISPFVNLAMKLASKGFVVTFAHVEFIHHMMLSQKDGKADLFSEARESGLDIRYTTIGDGFPLEYDRAKNSDEYWDTMLRSFPDHVDEFVEKTIRASPGLAPLLITDTMYTWPATIAKKHKLLNVSFWTQPALVFSLSYHMGLLRENGHYPCKDHVEEEINYLPGVESISTKDIMPFFKEQGTPSMVHRVARETFEKVKKADFILHNTIQELESGTLSALNKYQPNYAIGPINFSKNLATNTVSKSLRSGSNCTHWLDSKSPGSVLYVSFGSLVQTTKQVIEEIAYGLLISEVSFIWVVREDTLSSGDSDALLSGFKDEIKDKGLLVPWCDQIKVLSNPAVGGFLTHCGWNSTVESMWCGVPMICYPIDYDQLTNRKLVVDDWKIGINLCDRGTLIDRNEVAGKIRSLIGGPVSEALKKEANEVSVILKNVVDANGSSENNFSRFVEDLKAKLSADDGEASIT